MALYQRKDGKWHEIGALNKRMDGTTRPLSGLYQCINKVQVPLWESGNFRTADGMVFVTADNKTFNVTI